MMANRNGTNKKKDLADKNGSNKTKGGGQHRYHDAKEIKEVTSSSNGGNGSAPLNVIAAIIEKRNNNNNKIQTSNSRDPINNFWVFFMALLSFVMGVLTPPSIHLAHVFLTSTINQQRPTMPKTKVGNMNDLSPKTSLAVDCSTDEGLLSQYFHDEEVPGMHLMCIRQLGEEFRVTLHAGSVATNVHSFIIKEKEDYERQHHLFQSLTNTFDLGNRPIRNQPWALFGRNGNRVVEQYGTISLQKLASEGLLLLMEGGQWVWPGVREGFRRTVDLSFLPGTKSILKTRSNTTIIETLSLYPLVLSIDGFLSDNECDHIQDMASPRMKYSGVSLMDQDEGRSASDFRTSQSAFLASKTPALRAIDARTASLVRIPVKHQEHVQVLRYGKTEKYDLHYDFFDPAFYQNDPKTLKKIANGRRNRMATIFWYLSDVEEGGETNFPRYNRRQAEMDWCSMGLKVKPQRGKAIIFYSMTPDGALDEYSLHAACPVKEGVKWAANKWVWNAPFNRY